MNKCGCKINPVKRIDYCNEHAPAKHHSQMTDDELEAYTKNQLHGSFTDVAELWDRYRKLQQEYLRLYSEQTEVWRIP